MSKIKTVANLSCSRTNRGTIGFTVEDEHSGDTILELTIPLKEFALLVTGLGGIKVECELNLDANVAKKRIVERVCCEKSVHYHKQDQKDLVQQHFDESIVPLLEGWEIHSDGIGSQQRGDKHEYVIKKYVPVENVLDVERCY
jgi:hypothetical protein